MDVINLHNGNTQTKKTWERRVENCAFQIPTVDMFKINDFKSGCRKIKGFKICLCLRESESDLSPIYIYKYIYIYTVYMITFIDVQDR